jgi:lipid A disaccharide synthetase
MISDSKEVPETIELEDLELDAINSMIDDLSQYLKRQSDLQQQAQQMQQAIQQNNVDIMGTSRAVEAFIKTIVKSKGFNARYVFDRDKKQLILKR